MTALGVFRYSGLSSLFTYNETIVMDAFNAKNTNVPNMTEHDSIIVFTILGSIKQNIKKTYDYIQTEKNIQELKMITWKFIIK